MSWLDKYSDETPKAQNGIEGTMGGLTDKGFDYNGAWGGQFQDGGLLNSRQKRGNELLMKELKKEQKDKKELYSKGTIKNPKSIFYKKQKQDLQRKQTFVEQDDRTEYVKKLDEEKGKAIEAKKQFKKNVIAPLDFVTDLMQVGNFIPHPAAQSVAKLGNIGGAAIDAWQAADDLSEENYTGAAINAASVLLPAALNAKTFRRNSKYLQPGQPLYPFSPQANLPANATISQRLNIPNEKYIEPFTKVRGMTDANLLANRALLGTLGAETVYDAPEFQEGGIIPIAQKGKQVKPLYVESKNDPRYRAYQDSLKLYNHTSSRFKEPWASDKKFKKPVNSNKNSKEYKEALKNYYDEDVKKSNIKPTNIIFSDRKKDTYIPVFKKPEQPIIVKDPDAPQRKTVRISDTEGRFELVERPKIEALQNNLQPEDVVSNFDIEASTPIARREFIAPKYYNVEDVVNRGKSQTNYKWYPRNQDALRELSEEAGDRRTMTPVYQNGGSMPGAVGFRYARTQGIPSEGPYAKKTMPSAQNGQEMKYYQEGLDWRPKTISQNGKKIKIKDEREQAMKSSESTGVKKRNFDLEQSKENKAYINAVAAQKKEAARRAKLTKEQREREDYNAYNEERGSINKYTPETTWQRTKAVVSNPMTAAGYIARGENLPGNFQAGPRNTHDYALDWVNPLQGLVALSEIPGELSREEYLNAGLSALDALDLGVYARGAKKTLEPVVKKGMNQLGNIRTSLASKLKQGLRTADPSFESSVDNVAPTFKSEIDWGKWNEEIPKNTQLMDEYNAIEQQAKADGTWMKYEKKVLDEEKTLNNKRLFDEQEKEFNIKNAQEEEVRKSLYEADKAKIKIEETNKLLDLKFQDYFDNASAQWKRNFENNPESKLDFLDVKGVTSKEIDNALESLSSNVKSREADLLAKYESVPVKKFDRPNESVYTTSIEDFPGTPEQFIQVNSENFKKAYPEGWETVWRGGDRNPELNTKYIKNGEVIFTSKDEYGANVYNRSDNPEIKLSNTETPQEGLVKLYAPKTENKIVIDGDDSYIYDGRRISGDDYRKNYARLDAINQTPITSLQQENLNTFQKWMRKNYPEVDLTDRTMTDHFASFLNSPEGRNIDRVEFKKIFDGTLNPIDVEVHNLNNKKQLKSMFGNNGMFDMTNPNIYKSVLPFIGYTAAGTLTYKVLQGQEEPLPGMRKGGIIKDDRGQWAHPGEITEINSNDITMEGVPYPVLGISDTGDTKLMKPGKNYKFKGKKVTEFPMAKNGINDLDAKPLQKLDNLLNFTNYNTDQSGGWLDKFQKGGDILDTSSSYVRSLRSAEMQGPQEEVIEDYDRIAALPATNTGIAKDIPIPVDGAYVVQKGDTLSKIAKESGVSVNNLAKVNKIKDVDQIKVNQKLLLPAVTQTKPLPEKYQNWDVIKKKTNILNKLSDLSKIVSYHKSTPDEIYSIVDKKNSKLLVYQGDKLIKSFEVGTGQNPGDAQTVTKIVNGKTDWDSGNKSTGAGIYTVSNVDPSSDAYYGLPSFNLKNEQGIEVATSIHGTPKQRRKYFNNNTLSDNRMSNGCINGQCKDLPEMYNYLTEGTKVYILPEDKGNSFEIVDGKPVFRVDPKNSKKYETYIDKKGVKQKGQGVNRTTNTLVYKPIRPVFNEEKFKDDVFTTFDFNDEKEYNKTTKPFIKGLTENKKAIMQAAQIPSDVYNELAKMAFGIYGTESNYGDTHSAVGNLSRAAVKFISPSNSSSPDYEAKATTYGADEDTRSVGLTQIRWSYLNKKEKEVLKKLGITSNKDFLDPKKAAIGTTAVLGVRYNEQLTSDQKKDIWKNLPTKWNKRENYPARVKSNSSYLNFEQLD